MPHTSLAPTQAQTRPGGDVAVPRFDSTTVTDFLRDGYWLEAPDITGNGKPDLIGHGLKTGELYWYENPTWEKRILLDKIKEPVGADFANITGKNGDDYIVCYQLYGPGGTIHHADPDGGKIDWLENPGPEAARRGERWQRHHVGRAIGMHRLRAGHFTRHDRIQILGFPIVAVESVHAVLPIVLYTAPDNVHAAAAWETEVINDNQFRMIHGVARKPGLAWNGLDGIIMASDEGVTWVTYTGVDWEFQHIGVGENRQFEQTTFRGSGDVDGGRLGDDPLGFVAALEPFHGNAVAVYVKDPQSPRAWKRHLLDIYGDHNENGEGPGHSVMCADFDGDGEDEFLIGLRGPEPWQGAVYYKAIDAVRGIFVKWKVGNESTARIVAADFTGTGSVDFATISYSVEHYFVAPRAEITLHTNETGR